MEDHQPLRFHEEIMLLALRDKEGTIAPGAMYQFAIGGAIAAELLMNGRIEVEESKRKLVDLVSHRKVGDPVIDECLEKITSAKRRAPLQTWVSRFSGVKNLKHRVAEQLCGRGILKADEEKILLLFRQRVYPEANRKPERELKERLRKAIFTSSGNIDPRTTVLVSLANSSGLLRANFDKRKLRERKKRIEEIINGELTGKATKQAIDAMHAAIMVACLIPVITTTISN